MGHVRWSRPYSGLKFQIEVLESFKLFTLRSQEGKSFGVEDFGFWSLGFRVSDCLGAGGLGDEAQDLLRAHVDHLPAAMGALVFNALCHVFSVKCFVFSVSGLRILGGI